MRVKILVTLMLSLGLLGCSAAKEKVRIGLQPNEGSRDIDALKLRVEAAMKADVEIVISKDYSALVQMLKEKKVDFAVLSPLNFVTAEKEIDLKVLFKKVYGDSEFYYSALLAREDGKIRKIQDVKGKKIAFVDEKSTSGHLYPRVMLEQAGISKADVEGRFSGTHVDALEALFNNEVDVAAVWADSPEMKTGAWTGNEFKDRKLPQLRVIQYSEPIPNDAIVVRSQFYEQKPKLVLNFMSALISMSESGDKILKNVFGVDKLATATTRHYDSVRKIQELKD